MNSITDWTVVSGFLLAGFGLLLRIILMMRSSDAQPVSQGAKDGRDLLRSYGNRFPKSRLPLLMWTSLSTGLILLIAGFLLEFR